MDNIQHINNNKNTILRSNNNNKNFTNYLHKKHLSFSNDLYTHYIAAKLSNAKIINQKRSFCDNLS